MQNISKPGSIFPHIATGKEIESVYGEYRQTNGCRVADLLVTIWNCIKHFFIRHWEKIRSPSIDGILHNKKINTEVVIGLKGLFEKTLTHKHSRFGKTDLNVFADVLEKSNKKGSNTKIHKDQALSPIKTVGNFANNLKECIIEADKRVLIPFIFPGKHWYNEDHIVLIVVDKDKKEIGYYDSKGLSSDDPSRLNVFTDHPNFNLRTCLEELASELFGECKIYENRYVYQRDAINCGAFVFDAMRKLYTGEIKIKNFIEHMIQSGSMLREDLGNFMCNCMWQNDTSEIEAIIDDFKKSEKYPQFQKIIEIICNSRGKLRFELINALYVLVGIKPVLVVEKGSKNDISTHIEMFSKDVDNLKWIKFNHGHCYLINETPLSEFDPRRFIDKFDDHYESLEAAVTFAFPDQNKIVTDKLLSYLLGFGPTWEAYAGIVEFGYLDSNTSLSIFSEEHYFQLGKAICKKEDNGNVIDLSRSQLIKKGERFSLNVSNHNWRPIFDKKAKKISITKEINEIYKLYMVQQIDEISYQTDYIQKGIMYRKRLLELLSIPQNG